MTGPDCTRTIIIGNGGAGKSWLADAIAHRLGTHWTELDALRWGPGFTGVKRDAGVVVETVATLVAGRAWIIEGAYAWLAGIATPRATALIWLDLPVSQCVSNVQSRPRRPGESETDVADTVAWAASYEQRRNGSSRAAHLALFEGHAGDKWQLTERSAVEELLGQVQTGQG